MCCEVEVVEDDLLALDVQLTHTAWRGRQDWGRQGEHMEGQEASQLQFMSTVFPLARAAL